MSTPNNQTIPHTQAKKTKNYPPPPSLPRLRFPRLSFFPLAPPACGAAADAAPWPRTRRSGSAPRQWPRDDGRDARRTGAGAWRGEAGQPRTGQSKGRSSICETHHYNCRSAENHPFGLGAPFTTGVQKVEKQNAAANRTGDQKGLSVD